MHERQRSGRHPRGPVHRGPLCPPPAHRRRQARRGGAPGRPPQPPRTPDRCPGHRLRNDLPAPRDSPGLAGTTEDNREHVEREIAVAKGWITWQTRDITIEARERCGARGLFPHNGIALFPQNVDGAITAEGDNLAIWVKAAAEMLFEHSTAPLRAVPLESPGRDGAEPGDLRALLAAAQHIWTARARTRLRADRYRGQERWNATCLPALEAVGAHASGRAADAFITAVANTRDSQARLLLEELCRLFLLQQLKPHTGDLLAAGQVVPAAVREFPDAIEQSMTALTPHMLTLVDAFQLPDDYLASIPIANPTYQDADDNPNAHWNT